MLLEVLFGIVCRLDCSCAIPDMSYTMAVFLFSATAVFLCPVISGLIVRGEAEANNSKRILIKLRYRNTIRALKVSPYLLVGDLRRTAAKQFGLVQTDEFEKCFFIRARCKILRCYDMTLEAAGISSYCEVICGLDLRGGAGAETTFKSIPVANLRELLQRIKADFDDWVKKENPVYQKRFDGDKLAGEAVVWNGFSGSVQYYFKTKGINPSEKYKDLYSNKRHTIAVSYVWSVSGLLRIAGEWMFPIICIHQSIRSL